MEYKHLEFIQECLRLNGKTAEEIISIGNNLNDYLPFSDAEAYVNQKKKKGDDRVQKSSKDVILGLLVEETVVFLLDQYFSASGNNYLVTRNVSKGEYSQLFDTFKLSSKDLREKKFDVDILIKKQTGDQKVYLLSVKGTARERIGQFFSNLFFLDDRVVKLKYDNVYYLEHKREGWRIKYGFVCLDWSKSPDFTKYTKKGNRRNTLKETEVDLINTDSYISGGITILNNNENFDGILNFEGIVKKIVAFLG